MHDFYLQPKQLFIWIIPLEKIELTPDWVHILSLDERLRTFRYLFKKDQDQFVRSRLALRLLLSKYLTILPEEIIFEYNELGKPYLAKNHCLKRVEFNLSHSEEILAIGITQDILIGIDIESIARVNDLLPDESIFTEYEYTQMRNYPMYNFWVAKEAYLKMTGWGLQHPLNDVQIDMKDNLAVKLSTKQSSYLTFFSFDEKLAGAACTNSPPTEVYLKMLDWNQLSPSICSKSPMNFIYTQGDSIFGL